MEVAVQIPIILIHFHRLLCIRRVVHQLRFEKSFVRQPTRIDVQVGQVRAVGSVLVEAV